MTKTELIEQLYKSRDIVKNTQAFRAWLQSASDEIKQKYAINWKLPHSVFNVSCNFFDECLLQYIDWFAIHKGRRLGYFTNGNKVRTIF